MPRPIDLRALSKTISHALRHEPWLYELELNEEGWTALDTLIEAMRRRRGRWQALSRRDVEAIIAGSDKVRFEIRGDQIRALYGHSLPGKLTREIGRPPDILYHGTSPDTADVIRSEGLRLMGRQYVHLSSDVETAEQVGRRKSGTPVILEIAAGAAHTGGIDFYVGNERVWLADGVPAQFIRG